MDDSESPKFTVNQIMLLQKLKQTGLTKTQILKGLEEMEKLEELGLGNSGSNSHSLPTVSSPSSQCSAGSTSNGPTSATANRDTELPRRSTSPSSPRIKYPGAAPLSMPQTNPLMFGTHIQTPNQLNLLPQVGSWSNSSQAVAVATAASLLQNGFGPGAVPHSVYPNLLNGRGIGRNGCMVSSNIGGNTVVEIDDEKIDITEELDDLFRRDQSSVKEDIKKFISERHISQSAIAKATKNAISQSYISQWLAQPQDISGQKKKAIYTWFIMEKRKTVGLSNGTSNHQPLNYRNEIEQDCFNSHLLKSKRGARFTWPKECLSILEGYYNENAYPDECKREEIAHACNLIIQSQKPGGIIHSELDKVTTVKVYNWFANRRKDDKRRRHIEHIEALGQQALLSPRRSSTVSPTPSCNSNESHREEESSPVSVEKVSAVVKRENTMSLAMEMAAVNKSILTLVNPHREFASHEDKEDLEDDVTYSRNQESKHFRAHNERLTECGGYAV